MNNTVKIRAFFLRKGIVVEVIPNDLYVANDVFTKEKISVQISGRERMSGLELDIGETIYIVVSEYDLERGRYYSEHQVRGLNIDFKSMIEQLDNGINPLKEVLKKVVVTEIKANATYLVKDILTSEQLTMTITGKMRMNDIKILVDDIVYMILPNITFKTGTYSHTKYLSSDLSQQKQEIEEREKNQL